MNDHDLLREFAVGGFQSAFRKLVERHLPLVHSTARRRLGDAHLAEDVSQQVFALLAAKAAGLNDAVVLSGWLYRTTCHVAADVQRKDARRRIREQAAVEAMNLNSPDATWRELEPLLDDAMAALSEADRDAVVLRFFEDRSLREVGTALGVTEDAAQKRLSRAIERLRTFFADRGRPIEGGALTAAIVAGAIQPVPAGLAASVATAALAGAAAAGATSTTMGFMSLKPILTTIGALTAASLLYYQHGQVRSAQEANTALAARLAVAEHAAAEASQQVQALRTAAENDPRILELARLRGEVAGLRRDATRLTAEKSALNAALEEAVAKASRPAIEVDADVVKDQGIARLNYAKQWMLALMMFASDNGERFPGSLAEAKPYFGSPRAEGLNPAQQGFLQGLTADQFELVYTGSLVDLKNPAGTIVIRERQGWPVPPRPGLSRTYGFADGHSEIHYAADGNFDAWEQERLVGR